MSVPVLQVWSAPKCEPGAEVIAPLPATTSAAITEADGSNQATGSLALPKSLAASVAAGRVLRALVPLRGTVEWVILGVSDSVGDDASDSVSVTLGGLRHLLTIRGRIRDETGSATTYTVDPGEATVTELLERHVLTNLAADGLSWLSLGTITKDVRVKLSAFTHWSRGQLLTAIEQAAGGEFTLRALANDAGYALDFAETYEPGADEILLECPGFARAITRTVDLLQAASVVTPFGTDGAPLGEIDWTGGAAIGAGPYWIPLTDPEGGEPPIREDGQFATTYLGLPDGTSLYILDSRASDSAVKVGALGTYATGQAVVFWETATGRPVTWIDSPSGLASPRGRCVATVRVAASGSRRNLLSNSGLQTDATGYSSVNGSAHGVEIARAELGVTETAQANGTRGAGTGTGTPFAIDGRVPMSWVRKGDPIDVTGTTYTVNAWAITDLTGRATVSMASGLTADLPDATPFVFRRQTGSLTFNATAFSITQTASTTPPSGYLGEFTYTAGTSTLSAVDQIERSDIRFTLAGTFSVFNNGTLSGTANSARVQLRANNYNGAIADGTAPFVFCDSNQDVTYANTAGPTLPSGAAAILRETRTIYLDGAHLTGDTTLAFRELPARTPLGGVTLIATTGVAFTIDAEPTWSVDGSGNATATVALTAPLSADLAAGVTCYRAGDFAYNNAWTLHAGATAGDLSLVLRGADRNQVQSASDPAFWATDLRAFTGVYRIGPGSTASLVGERLYAAASAQANGSGQVSVTLSAANVAAIPDNTTLTITRPDLIAASDRRTGSMLRLFCAVGGSGVPVFATPGMQSPAVTVAASADAPKALVLKGWFNVTPETLAPGSAPVIALVNLTTNAILDTATIAASTAYSTTPSEIPVSLAYTLTSTASLALRIYGGSSALFERWHLFREAVLYVGTDETITYFVGAEGRIGFQRAQEILRQRRDPSRYRVTGIDQAALRGLGQPLVRGQRVRLRAPASAIDTVQRVSRLVWVWPGAHLVEAECAVIAPRFTDVDVSLT